MKTFTLGAAAVLMTAALIGVPAAPGADGATAASHPITWLAAGDSYSSDVGLPHTSHTCGRAVAPSVDWATYAWTKLRSRLDVVKPDLVACSGAKTGEFFANQSKGHPAEYGKPSPTKTRYDLVTFTFGGDNIGFASVVSDCLIYAQQGGACENTSVRKSISAFGSIYPDFLNTVAKGAVVKGGNVVVMGYPELLEDPKLWAKAEQAVGSCDGFPVALTNLMRGWAGDLNATIGSAVSAANAMPGGQRNDVTFTFIDPVSGGTAGIAGNDQNLFEPSSGPRHELCSPSGRAWLNGIQLDHPKTKSFHPNQYGEHAMGSLADEVIPHLTWPRSQTSPQGQTSQQNQTPPQDQSTVAVHVCATTFGGGGQATPQPSSITARTSMAELPSMVAYTDAQGISEVLAPAGWDCSAFIGADLTTGISVWPPGAPAPGQNSTVTQGIEAFVYPGANIGGQYDLVCAAFLQSSSEIGQYQPPCPTTIPSDETDTTLRSDTVAFEDPPGVDGSWDNSSGTYSANGVLIYDYGGVVANTTSEQAACLLPSSESTVCTASLNDFVVHYAHPVPGATTPTTTTTQPPTGTSGNTGSTQNPAPPSGGTGNTGSVPPDNSGSTGNTG